MPSSSRSIERPAFAVMGLGNPGIRYEGTRHNLGFRVVEALAEKAGATFHPGEGPFRICSFTSGGARGILAKPTTYMNRSGVAARKILEHYDELQLGRFLVVTDDLDLALGRIRFRSSGGYGGHKGLQSLIEELESDEFPRLRLGIGRPEGDEPGEVVDHVLDRFLSDELKIVREVVDRAAAGVAVFVGEGMDAAMNRFNAR